MDAWERVSGEKDPEMVRGLAELQSGALQREQGRIDDAVRKGSGGQ